VYVKNITVSVDDAIYHGARVEAARRRTSLSALVRDFLTELTKDAQREQGRSELEALWAKSDRKHARRSGSVGPLNREELHQRGVPRH
jgi:hypothetical protein